VCISVRLYTDEHAAPFRTNVIVHVHGADRVIDEPSTESEVRNSTVGAAVIQALDGFSLQSGRSHFLDSLSWLARIAPKRTVRD
jgi:hypothetical protein